MHAEGLGHGRPQPETFGLLDQKALQDLREDLVLVQELVGRRALLVAQQTKLARFVHHRRVGSDFLVLRCRQVSSNLIDEQGNVIEELLGREHLVWRDGQELAQACEPPGRERQSLGGDALPNHRGVVFRRERRHRQTSRN